MHDIIFIGDRLTAAGFRLAGVVSYAPDDAALAERVTAERERCRVMAMTAQTLAALPGDLARELREAQMPLLAIMPDIGGETAPPDMEAEVRRALGIEV